MPKYAIMRTAKVKSVASMANLEKHCTREKMPKNADPELSSENRSLLHDSMTLPERFAKMTDGQRIRKNAVLGIEVMMTYTPEAVTDGKTLNSWVKANHKWLCEEFGNSNVVRLWLHMDETTPHLHAFVVPLDARGKLNCREYLGGADKLSALQDRYADAMKPYGLERGEKGSKAHHRTVKEFYRAIESANSQSLPKPIQKTEKGLFGANKTVTEPIEEYYERANAAYKQKSLQFVAAGEAVRKEKEKVRTHISKHHKDMDELEKLRKGRCREKAELFDRLNDGLNSLQDQEHAKSIRQELQDIVDGQEHAEQLRAEHAVRSAMDGPVL